MEQPTHATEPHFRQWCWEGSGGERRGGEGVEGRRKKLQYWITTSQACASLLVAEHAAFCHNK